MRDQRRRRMRTGGALLATAAVITGGVVALPAAASPNNGVSVVQNPHDGTVTLSGGDVRLVLSHGEGASVSSLKTHGTEALATGAWSDLEIGGTTLDSRHPVDEPTVEVHGTSATVRFTMAGDDVSVRETWKLRATKKGVTWDVGRTYDWAADGGGEITHNGMVDFGWSRVWDNIRRPGDGGNIPIGNDYTGAEGFFLNEENDRYGVEQGDFVLLSGATEQALTVSADSERNLATEFAYVDGVTQQETQVSRAGTWEYTAGTPEQGYVYGGHSSNGTDALIYSPVHVKDGQHDSVDFTFGTSDYASYYDLGATVPGVEDTAALSSLLNDFGRSGVIDKDYGMSTVGLRYPGVGPYDMVYADRTVQGYFDPQMTRAQQNLLTYFKDYAQQSSGHMKGRTFHLDHEWDGGSLMDGDPAYASAVADMYDYSADKTWLRSMRASVEDALGYMIDEHYVADDGMFHNGITNCTSTKGAREWNDAFFVRYESGYVNTLMYQALTQWSELEKSVFGDQQKAQTYGELAAKLKRSFNKDIADGGLWDPETGMFAYWRCPDGTAQARVQHTQVNLQAIAFGMVDVERGREILDLINRQMHLQHLQLIPQNFIPIAPSTEEWTGDHFSNGIEDGSVYPFMTEEYMRAAAVVGERDKSLDYLNRTLDRYTVDGFNGFSFVHSTTLEPSRGEAWFPTNANGAAGLFSDVLGIQPTADGVTVAPNIPERMNGTTTTKRIHDDGELTVTYHSELEQTVRYKSHGKSVTMQWSGQEPDKTYTVRDNHSRHTVRADETGTVRYTFRGSAQHHIELVGGDADGYVLQTPPENLAYGKTVSTSSSLEAPLPGEPPSKAYSAASVVDGMPYSVDHQLGWISDADLDENHTESVTVDLGKTQTVGNVTLWPFDYDGKASTIGDNFPADFTIAVSTDGKNWTTQIEQSDYPKPTSLYGESFGFDSPVQARYIRVEGTDLRDDGGAYRMSLAEIQAFTSAAGGGGIPGASS